MACETIRPHHGLIWQLSDSWEDKQLMENRHGERERIRREARTRHLVGRVIRHLVATIALILVVSTSTAASAQPWSGIIPASRAIDWTQVGIPGGIPARTTSCSAIAAATYGNGTIDATSGIQAALNACSANQVVSLSAGTFRINGNLSIRSNVTLRGQGAHLTILDARGTSGAVVSLGSGNPTVAGSTAIIGGANANSTSIVVSSASGISVGKYLLITELNDASFVTIAGSEGNCSWCDGGIGWNGTRVRGQIVEVTSVIGTTIGIRPGLYLGYPNSPLATPFTASASYAGVEELQVYANHTGYRTNFAMSACAYCWIKGVEGNHADGDHLEIDWSYRGEISNNYFSNAYSHNPGGTDADMALRNKSSAMLVQNNIMERLHGGIMLEWGAAGNVIAYNYLFGAFAETAPNFTMDGLSNHGAHPQLNLYEGNIDFHAHFDSVWGSHSHGTLFRNWFKGTTKVCNPLTGRGTVTCSPMGAVGDPGVNGWWAIQGTRALDINFLGSSYNSVGNVLGSAEMAALTKYNQNIIPLTNVRMVVAVCGPTPCGSGSRSYDSQAYEYSLGYGESVDNGSSGFDSLVPYSTLLLHGDYSNTAAAITWAGGLSHTLAASYYLAGKPSWFGSVPYPPIGPDVTGGPGPGGHAYKIPAQVCYENVMGGTDGAGSPRSFNADACYGSGRGPQPPTNLQVQ
jgi:hypothetical protein